MRLTRTRLTPQTYRQLSAARFESALTRVANASDITRFAICINVVPYSIRTIKLQSPARPDTGDHV